jgi:AcrR family transcriptional regulator
VTSSSAGRARPLPPDERRAALVAATLPLICRYGTKVTTRQIAEAAGVAEGTIFRAFPDKDALVREAVAAALNPAPVLAELGAVESRLPLRERLIQITEILQRRLTSIFNLMVAVRLHGPPEDAEHERVRGGPAHAVIYAAVVGLLEPDREQFRCPVQEVARLLRLLTFAGTHPMITDGSPLTAEEIVSVLLDGVRQRHPDGEGHQC